MGLFDGIRSAFSSVFDGAARAAASFNERRERHGNAALTRKFHGGAISPTTDGLSAYTRAVVASRRWGGVGEAIMSRLLAGGGLTYGYPSGWSQDRLEQVLHLRAWVGVAVTRICEEVAGLTPNIAVVSPANEIDAASANGSPGRPDPRRSQFHRHFREARYRKSLQTVKPHEEVEHVSDQHPLARLLARPNAWDTAGDLWYELVLFLKLTGNSYLWAVPSHFGRLTGRGEPCQLWVLPAHWVWPKLGINGGEDGIEYYEIRPWVGSGILKIPPEEIIHFKIKNPIHKVDGNSPLQQGAEWIDASESVNSARFWAFKNGCFPMGNLKLSAEYGDPDDSELDRIYAKFFVRLQGEMNSGKPIITPPGAEYVPLTIAPKEMLYTESAEQLFRWVMAMFAIPPELVVPSPGKEIAAYGPMQQFARYCITPLVRQLGQVLTQKLASRWDDRLRIWWDDPTPDNPQQVNADIQLLWESGATCPNEIRTMKGLEPWPHGGDNPLMPPNLVEIPYGGEVVYQGQQGQQAGGGAGDLAAMAGDMGSLLGNGDAGDGNMPGQPSANDGGDLPPVADRAEEAAGGAPAEDDEDFGGRGGAVTQQRFPDDQVRALGKQWMDQLLKDWQGQTGGQKNLTPGSKHSDPFARNHKCRVGPNAGKPGVCPEDQGGSGGSNDAIHSEAGPAAQGWAAKAGKLPSGVWAKAKAMVQQRYAQLAGRYGKPTALVIMAAGILGSATPVPGGGILAAAPIMGVAELYLRLRGSGDSPKGPGNAQRQAPPGALERARRADLVTLPEGTEGTNCGNCKFVEDGGYCGNPKVDQPVNDHMCCALWDADGTQRAWQDNGDGSDSPQGPGVDDEGGDQPAPPNRIAHLVAAGTSANGNGHAGADSDDFPWRREPEDGADPQAEQQAAQQATADSWTMTCSVCGAYRVRVVNEEELRNSSLSLEEFGQSAIHSDFPDVIPEDEIWIGDSLPAGEFHYVLGREAMRLKAERAGADPDTAYEWGLHKERAERAKRAGNFRRDGGGDDPRQGLFATIKGDGSEQPIQVVLVDGRAVRDRFKTDYIEGGQHAVYPWVPDGEIWVESGLSPHETAVVALHEAVEYWLMTRRGLDYDHAHELAARVEYQHRPDFSKADLEALTPAVLDEVPGVEREAAGDDDNPMGPGGDWDESKHPRADDGKFGSGSGSAGVAASGSNNQTSDTSSSNDNKTPRKVPAGGKVAAVDYEGGNATKSQAEKVLGIELSNDHFAGLTGATADSSVSVKVKESPNGRYGINNVRFDDAVGPVVSVSIKGKGYWATRHFYRDKDGSVVVYNEAIEIKDTGKGLGTEIFSRQVAGLAAMGVSRIECFAEGQPGDEEFNGYYTWPRLGYDGKIPEVAAKRLPKEFAGTKTVQEVLRKPSGLEAWKKYGTAFKATFDVSPGSQSRKVLDAYMQERKQRGAGK